MRKNIYFERKKIESNVGKRLPVSPTGSTLEFEVKQRKKKRESQF